jgi:hypothetical protein
VLVEPAAVFEAEGVAVVQVVVVLVAEHGGVVVAGAAGLVPGLGVVGDELLPAGSSWSSAAAGALADPACLDPLGAAFVGLQRSFGVAGLDHLVAEAEDEAGDLAVAQPGPDQAEGQPGSGGCDGRQRAGLAVEGVDPTVTAMCGATLSRLPRAPLSSSRRSTS